MVVRGYHNTHLCVGLCCSTADWQGADFHALMAHNQLLRRHQDFIQFSDIAVIPPQVMSVYFRCLGDVLLPSFNRLTLTGYQSLIDPECRSSARGAIMCTGTIRSLAQEAQNPWMLQVQDVCQLRIGPDARDWLPVGPYEVFLYDQLSRLFV